MSKKAQAPLGRYGDLRSGGMLPQETKDHLARIYWAFMAGLLAACFMFVIAKTIGHHAALTCGAC